MSHLNKILAPVWKSAKPFQAGATVLSLILSYNRAVRRLIVLVSLFLYFLWLVPSGVLAQDTGDSAGGVDTSGFKYRGVNIKNLQTYPASKIEKTFSYLPNCNINTVRTMALENLGGVDALAPAAALAQQYGIQLVVALDDYAGGSSTLPTGTVHPNPMAWYSGGYIDTGHYQYVLESASKLAAMPAVSVIELANEPHCGRTPGCLDPYTAWVTADVAALAGTGKIISIGTGMLGAVDTPGEGFETINSVSGIGQASTHWYPEDMPGREENLAQAATIAKGLGEEILLGEVGFSCVGGDNCMSSVNDEQRAGWLAKMFQMIGDWGYDGLLYWTFGGFRDGFDYYSENDNHSWFPSNPGSTEDPICKAFRGEIPPREFDFGATSEDQTGEVPLFVYPQTEDLKEWEKYLSNSNVYCAPGQINWPQLEGTDPSLPKQANVTCQEAPAESSDPLEAGNLNPNESCEYQEYPVVEYREEYQLRNATVPLWRDQTGMISIEIDLSRVTPGDTFAQAVENNMKPAYAPQFYLTTPQQQCTNAANYLEYVTGLCDRYDTSGDCPAKSEFELLDGRKVTWEAASAMLPVESCVDFSEAQATNNDVAQLVAAIAPRTPKVFKMGFLVQHNYLFSQNNPLIGAQYFVKKLAAWLTNDPSPIPTQGEKLTIIPVWYQSGISSNEYSPDQIAPYPIDPENPPAEPTTNLENFAGGWWRTYAPALPLQTQEKIMQEKTDHVVQNYSIQEEFSKIFGTTASLEHIIPCDGLRCIEDDPQFLEDLRASFPDGFEPSDEFLQALQKIVATRVNSGVQRTAPYPQEKDGSTVGPLSEREFTRCDIDQENYRYGESETADSVNYNLIQKLREDDSTTVGEAIKEIVNEFTAKILWDKGQSDAEQSHISYSYLVLPDESIDIDIAQTYFAPMFLSPQMYESIMSGENPIYPFASPAPDGVPEGEDYFLSSFLRTSGYDRDLDSDKEGYVKVETAYYGATCDAAEYGSGACRCGSEPIVSSEHWETYPADVKTPTYPECVGVNVLADSLVSVTGEMPNEDPDSNIENPGNLASLHEYLRRMAFTPSYLVGEYPGLEEFYGGSTSPFQSEGVDKDTLEELSEYYNEFIANVSQTYSSQPPANQCEVLLVNQSEAQQAANLVEAMFDNQTFVDWLNNKYDNPILFGDCGGTSCVNVITSTTTSTPLGDGFMYTNPLVALAVALMENGRIRRDPLDWHYSCNMTAFADYDLGATVDGLSCAVENAAGNQVINPVIVAMTSQTFAGRPEIVDICAPGSPLDPAARKKFSFPDGLACFMSVLQSQYRLGNNDSETLKSYGYVAPATMIRDRLQGIAAEYEDALQAAGEYDSAAQSINQQFYDAADTLFNQMLSGC